MNNLAKILEYAYAENTEKKKLLNSDDFPVYMKELLLDSETQESNLVRHEIHNALTDGASKRAVIRRVLPIINVNTNAPLIPSTLSPSNYIDPVAQGANIPLLDGNFISGQVDIKKYSTRIGITNELIEDKEWDVISIQVQRAGALIENSLNRTGITALLDGHDGTTPGNINPAGTNIALTDLVNARYQLKKLYWGGGNMSFIGHPLAIRHLLNSTDLAPFVAPNDGGTLLGVNIFELASEVEHDATNKWTEAASAGNYYGILLDSDNYAIIGMRDDIHISSEIRDPIYDLTNLNVSARFGVKVINKQAAVRILSK